MFGLFNTWPSAKKNPRRAYGEAAPVNFRWNGSGGFYYELRSDFGIKILAPEKYAGRVMMPGTRQFTAIVDEGLATHTDPRVLAVFRLMQTRNRTVSQATVTASPSAGAPSSQAIAFAPEPFAPPVGPTSSPASTTELVPPGEEVARPWWLLPVGAGLGVLTLMALVALLRRRS